jgi:hypothetical protein
MRTADRNCSGCRYWSEMLAQAGGGTINPRGDVEAMCLSDGPRKGKYTTAETTCDAYAKNSHGAVDDPPNYGEESRAAYEREAATKYPNGKPMFAPDGTMLDDKGNRSIFDDVDEGGGLDPYADAVLFATGHLPEDF